MKDSQKNLVETKLVEAYLDILCAQLKSVASARRHEIRREIRQHLEMLMADCSATEEGAQAALAKFGDPASVGKKLRRAEQRAIFRDNLRGGGALVFALLLWTASFGCFLMVEMFRMFGWGSDVLLRGLVGPLPPLVLGWYWGMGRLVGEHQRRGYALLAAIAFLAAAPFPVPGYLAHVDLMTSQGQYTVGSLAGYARLGHVLVWMWIACSACGLASFFTKRHNAGRRAVIN